MTGAYPTTVLTLSSALLAVGIEVRSGDRGHVELTNIDHRQEKGFKVTRFAIADRWGMYREFDDRGNHLHARACHKMRTKTGCPRALRFDGCGCACPYLHARSSELGKWLVASARNETSKEPTPWDRLLAHKDDDGRLLLSGLPYANGLCVAPTEWEELNPSHKSPKKHKPLTHEERLETINAVREETMTEIKQTQEKINVVWEQMRNYW